MSEIKPKSKRGGKRPNAGRRPRSAQAIAAQVNDGKIPYVRADQAVGVRSAFAKILEEQGCTDEKVATRIVEGLDAQETVFAKFEGKITDSVDVVAWSERRAYVELACKIKNVIPRESEPDRAPITVQIVHIAGDVVQASEDGLRVIEVGS